MRCGGIQGPCWRATRRGPWDSRGSQWRTTSGRRSLWGTVEGQRGCSAGGAKTLEFAVRGGWRPIPCQTGGLAQAVGLQLGTDEFHPIGPSGLSRTGGTSTWGSAQGKQQSQSWVVVTPAGPARVAPPSRPPHPPPPPQQHDAPQLVSGAHTVTSQKPRQTPVNPPTGRRRHPPLPSTECAHPVPARGTTTEPPPRGQWQNRVTSRRAPDRPSCTWPRRGVWPAPRVRASPRLRRRGRGWRRH